MYLPAFLFLSDTPTASGLVLKDKVGGSSRFRKTFRRKGWAHPSIGTAPSRHLAYIILKRKIQLEQTINFPQRFPETWLRARNSNPASGKKKKHLLRHHFRLAGPANVQIWRKTYALRIRPHNAQAHGEAPAPSRSRRGARTRNQPPTSAARGFRPEAWRSPFGSGSNPALTR